MSEQVLLWIAGITVTGIFGAIGWVITMIFNTLKDHRDNHDNLEKRFAAHKLHTAETYATKTDVKEGFDRVMSKLDKIDDKLDSKADKK